MGELSQIVRHLPRGHLFGLTLSNNGADATNDIDFAAGSARDSTDVQNLELASAMTKRLDAAWAAGSGAGGRMSAAAIADTTYFCFVIGKPDGTIDVGFDTSPTAPTLPTGYTTFRRIGAILRASGAIRPFFQDGDEFTLVTYAPNDTVDNAGTSEIPRVVTVPIGIIVRAKLLVQISTTTISVTRALRIADPRTSTSNVKEFSVSSIGTAGTYAHRTVLDVNTDTAGRVSTILSASEAGTVISLFTYGWFDQRGRFA